MNRLQSELHRLYLAPTPAGAQTDPPSATVRALVIELTNPPCWEDLSRVWYGVQTELELPAAAIAVSGVDGLQLWFSVAEPIQVTQAHAFLEGLCAHFLSDIKASRVRLMPASDASTWSQELQTRLPPTLQEASENWSAFVAPDLAPVFADTPWLDVAPSEEGQAALLRGLKTMTPSAFHAALEKLTPATPAADSIAPVPLPLPLPLAHARPVRAAGYGDGDPQRFLLKVMNDETVPLALRIEAAKALLAHSNEPQTQQID